MGTLLVSQAPVSRVISWTRPEGLDTTGETDVTADILTFMGTLSGGEYVQFDAGATYLIDGGLIIEGIDGLTIDFNGATFTHGTDGALYTPVQERAEHQWPRNRSHWWFVSCDDLYVFDGIMQGVNPDPGAGGTWVVSLEAQHGIVIHGCERATVRNITVQDVYGDGLFTVSSSDVRVRLNLFQRLGRQGLAISSGSRLLIDDNEIKDMRRSWIDLEPDTDAHVIERVAIRNNTTTDIENTFIAAASTKGTMRYITIEKNVVDEVMNITIGNVSNVNDQHHIFIRDNVQTEGNVHGSPLALIRLSSLREVDVIGNTAAIATTQSKEAVKFRESCGYRVTGNNWGDNWEANGIINVVESNSTAECV